MGSKNDYDYIDDFFESDQTLSFDVIYYKELKDFDFTNSNQKNLSIEEIIESMKDEIETLVQRYRREKSVGNRNSEINKNTLNFEKRFCGNIIELVKRMASQEISSVHIDTDGMDLPENHDQQITGKADAIGQESSVYEPHKFSIKVTSNSNGMIISKKR